MSHPGRLEGKVAIVTGGGLGLGEGIVRKFVDEGAKVLVFELNMENGEKVASSLGAESAACFTGDVTKAEDWDGALKICKEKFGGLDIVANNAGVVHRSAVRSTPRYYSLPLNLTQPALNIRPPVRIRAHHAH